MKQLLQEALDVLECYDSGNYGSDRDVMDKLRAAIDAQEQEPVAWMVYVSEANNQYVVDDINDQQLVDDCTNHNAEVTPLYTKPQTVAELMDDEIVKIAIASRGA